MRTSLIISLVTLAMASAQSERVRGSGKKKRKHNGTERRLAYNYYTIENKIKLSDVDSGGAGRFRDEDLHDPDAPTDPPQVRPTKAPATPPTHRPTQFTTKAPQRGVEFPVDELENPGFDNQNEDFDQEMDDPEVEQAFSNGGLPGFVQANFGPLFRDRKGKKIRGAKDVRNAVVDNFSLGSKRLYGITEGPDMDLYISELLFGGVLKLNISSGIIDHVVPSYEYFERPSGGLAYYRDTLIVAGLGQNYFVEPCIHVYDAITGDEIISCEPDFPAREITDVTVLGNMAYATDSMLNQIVAMNIDDAIDGICNVTSIKLPVNDFLSDEIAPFEFATGIVGYENGLIISNNQVGGLFYLDLESGRTAQFVDQSELPNPTGLSLHNNKFLFVSQSGDIISMWKLKKDREGEVQATNKGVFNGDDMLDDPRSSVFIGNTLFAVNSKIDSLGLPKQREGHPDVFDEEFDLVAILV